MKSEIKINEEDNKSEIENIMPTCNSLFFNKYKNKNYNKINNNINLKFIYKRYNNNNLFSNIVLKELVVENKKNNTSLNKKNKEINKSNKNIKSNNQIQNICPIKKNSLQFLKGKIKKGKKGLDKKMHKYYFLQKNQKINKIPNIKDINCENNSFSIHYDNKTNNLNNINLESNNRLYSLKNSITIIKEKNKTNKNNLINIKNKRLINYLNENNDNNLYNKIKQSHSSLNYSLISPKNISMSIHHSRNLLSPKSSCSNNTLFDNDHQYNINCQNNKSLINDYNKIKNLFHKETINENNRNKILDRNFGNLSNIEYKNEKKYNEKPSLYLSHKNSSLKMYKSASLVKKDSKTFINKNKRIKSSYLRQIKFNFGFINPIQQNNKLNTRYINLKNYTIKDNIISNILDNIQENKFINNNLVSQIYKRPLINIFTLLDLKKNEKNL